MLIPQTTKSLINAAPVLSSALTKILIQSAPNIATAILPRIITRNLNFKTSKNQYDMQKDKETLQKKAVHQYKSFLSAEDAKTWAQKHFDNTTNTLTSEQTRSLLSYSWNKYGIVNQVLRSEQEKTTGNQEYELITNIQSVLKNSKIPENIIVYRRVKEDIFSDLKFNSYKDLIGQEIKEKGFLSTSLSLESLDEWKDKHNVQIKIKVPKNARGYYLGSKSLFEENEILFDKDHTLKITDIKANKQNIYVTCELTS